MTLAEQQALIISQNTGAEKSSESSAPVSDAVLAAAASRELVRRGARARYLPADFFSEGSWAILLDLFASEHNHRAVSVKSACIAAGVPATTALRCIEALLSREFITRSEAKDDKRLKLLCLTKAGRAAIRNSLLHYI